MGNSPDSKPNYPRHVRGWKRALLALSVPLLAACGGTPRDTSQYLHFTSPLDRGTITREYEDVSGVINPGLSPERDLWVVLRGQGDPHLHPQEKPVSFLDEGRRNWLLIKARFGYEGNRDEIVDFNIYAVTTSRTGSAHLRDYLRKGPEIGFPGVLQLPSDAEIAGRISVTRRAIAGGN